VEKLRFEFGVEQNTVPLFQNTVTDGYKNGQGHNFGLKSEGYQFRRKARSRGEGRRMGRNGMEVSLLLIRLVVSSPSIGSGA